MNNLWKIVNRFVRRKYAEGIFLAINIICWTVGTLLAGLFFCTAVAGAEINACIANVMCAAVYAGIIFGLFGGILFLMRIGGHTSLF